MSNTHTSLFNLIAIFGRSKKQVSKKPVESDVHCEFEHHHDFYCDAEQPFIDLK